jgi:hypothetical protein
MIKKINLKLFFCNVWLNFRTKKVFAIKINDFLKSLSKAFYDYNHCYASVINLLGS